MKAHEIEKTTTDNSTYNKVRKRQYADCDFCSWHGGCNSNHKWYGKPTYRKSKIKGSEREYSWGTFYDWDYEWVGVKHANWKLISKKRKQWMTTSKKRRVDYSILPEEW